MKMMMITRLITRQLMIQMTSNLTLTARTIQRTFSPVPPVGRFTLSTHLFNVVVFTLYTRQHWTIVAQCDYWLYTGLE